MFQDKIEPALKAYKDILENYPNLASLVYPKIADIYLKIKDYEQAIGFYRKSQELVPVNEMSNIQFKIAEARQAQGKPDEAIEEYLKVAYLYSENNRLVVKSLLRVAAIYEDRDNFKEAVNIYKKIALLDAEESKYAKEKIEWIRENIK
ncbi:MAG: tetratricopeptide repeat protein [Candidatus Omnitrophota bacterium]